ncbi:hypothetical protein D3C78_1686590 [compost metagenome]
MGQGVDQVGAQLLPAQLERLEQAGRTGAYHHGIGVNGWSGRCGAVGHRAGSGVLGGDQRCKASILPGLPFHSSASGSAFLRLVMLFQPWAKASSALSLMKAS